MSFFQIFDFIFLFSIFKDVPFTFAPFSNVDVAINIIMHFNFLEKNVWLAGIIYIIILAVGTEYHPVHFISIYR